MDGAKLAVAAILKSLPTRGTVFIAGMICLTAIAKNHPSDTVQICAIGAIVMLMVGFAYLAMAGKE